MTSDCYAILGVTPAAEDVVIGAAYRALMRHYHPDTNSDPQAKARAQEISAAYAVLRDPARRAEYDASRGGGGLVWDFEETAEPPPPMRTAGIATALLAVVLVGAVWAWPRPSDPPRTESAAVTRPAQRADPKAEPTARPEPSGAVLASAPPIRPPEPAPAADEVAPVEPVMIPPKVVEVASAGPVRRAPRLAPPPAPAPKTPTPPVTTAQAKAAEAKPGGTERVATLDRISSGFFSQSMVHATSAKKELLLAARDRSAAKRKSCRSDSCVADAYVREIRETSAIMEDRAGPK